MSMVKFEDWASAKFVLSLTFWSHARQIPQSTKTKASKNEACLSTYPVQLDFSISFSLRAIFITKFFIFHKTFPWDARKRGKVSSIQANCFRLFRSHFPRIWNCSLKIAITFWVLIITIFTFGELQINHFFCFSSFFIFSKFVFRFKVIFSVKNCRPSRSSRFFFIYFVQKHTHNQTCHHHKFRTNCLSQSPNRAVFSFFTNKFAASDNLQPDFKLNVWKATENEWK